MPAGDLDDLYRMVADQLGGAWSAPAIPGSQPLTVGRTTLQLKLEIKQGRIYVYDIEANVAKTGIGTRAVEIIRTYAASVGLGIRVPSTNDQYWNTKHSWLTITTDKDLTRKPMLGWDPPSA